MSEKKALIVVGGPTAVGKSAVAMALARHYQTDIINADSRQVYAELNIGVNKPSDSELKVIPHHLLGHVSVRSEYNAGIYEKEALQSIQSIFLTKNTAVLAGGTGLYIKSVIEGLDEFPIVSAGIKAEINDLYTNRGLEYIQQKLKELDPEYASEVDLYNPMRITRALEIIYTSGNTFSALRIKSKKDRDFNVIPVFIQKERQELYKIIDQRVDQMVDQGLKEEAYSLFPFKQLKALQTVGYVEWFDHFEGKTSETEAISKIKQHTRNYAKRQWTWWKPWAWPSFEANDLDKIIRYIDLKMGER